MVQSLRRKMNTRADFGLSARAVRGTQQLARTGQVSRSTVTVGDDEVFVDSLLVGASDTAESVELQDGEITDSRDISDDVVDVLPEMTEDAWEAEDVGQIAADGADWAAEFAAELDADLAAAKLELDQALADAHTALTEAGLARSEAAQAVSDAADAVSDATQAIEDALAAQNLANGVNKWATVAPVAGDASGRPIGAIWYVRNGSGQVTQVWELTALGWVQRPLSESVIPVVSIGSGTYGTLAGSRLVAESVTAGQIAALTITAGKIAADAVTAVKIAADAVTAEKILAGAIATDKLAALAVTAEKLAVGAVVADKIAAGAITTAKLAATAIDGMTITGSVIRTAATGQRLQFDVDGLKAFNTLGVMVASLNSSGGQLTLNGGLSLNDGSFNYGWVNSTGIRSAGVGRYLVHATDLSGIAHYDREMTGVAPYGTVEARGSYMRVRSAFSASGAARGFVVASSQDGGQLNLLSRKSAASSDFYFDIVPNLDDESYFIGGVNGNGQNAIVFFRDRVEVKGPIKFQAAVEFSGDRDWVTVTVPGITAGSLRIRQTNGEIVMEYDLTFSTNVAAGAERVNFVQLPSWAYPATAQPFLCNGWASLPATGVVTTSGFLTLRNNHSAALARFAGSGRWGK
ncbi:hypothetical protein [Leucobacter japonicus]|uniref:hypothetical protein n=1 Tax=Leucobacter japonicus TaxID=1461259 RepID=UPI0006A7E158|nr:hypothetical protein [Leucobacter japonicus]